MPEENGQEIRVTVNESDIEPIKNIVNVSSLIIFSRPPQSSCVCLTYLCAGQLPFPVSTVPIHILQKMECKYKFTMQKYAKMRSH